MIKYILSCFNLKQDKMERFKYSNYDHYEQDYVLYNLDTPENEHNTFSKKEFIILFITIFVFIIIAAFFDSLNIK